MKITKKAIEINRKYDRAIMRGELTLDDVYKFNYSAAKCSSYARIREEMRATGGHGLAITSYNGSFYTCAYVLDDNLVYHTPTKRVVLPRVTNYGGDYHEG